ncbi:MAG: Sua5/YciO/YrdC/YwlC family protein [Clostridia bacterium]|nr:Sua5/YciO/YrdC/YwlC family protein [Clostridia bacterium]
MKVFRHNNLKNLAQVVQQGGIIIYPTDTIWGLGCNALDEKTTTKLKKLKGKPADAALIWLLPSIKAVEKFCGSINAVECSLLKKKHTSVIIHNQAVRVVKSGWLNKFLTACAVPMVATSANVHGQPVITSWRQAVKLFNGQTDAVIRGRKIYKNRPSNLVKVAIENNQPVINVLRSRSTANSIK